MNIRRAQDRDLDTIIALLHQVCDIHADIRPDIFIHGGTKYSKDDLREIIVDNDRPIFVAVDDSEKVLGYCFCQYKETAGSRCIKPFSEIYIDDLCVDESARGQHVGQKLFEFVKEEAKRRGCYEVTLNVWEGNDSARAFYEKLGMKPKETNMEIVVNPHL